MKRRTFLARLRLSCWKTFQLTDHPSSCPNTEQQEVHLCLKPDAGFFVDLGGKHPQLRIYAEAKKGRRDRKLPLTPDFAQWLLETPQNERSGFVFPLPSLRHGEALERREVGKIVSQIGRKAGIIVNKAANKFASAHDLRRSFGTRWAKRVMPAKLQKLMRHSAIETTLRYYADIDADDLAADLWREYGSLLSDSSPAMTAILAPNQRIFW